MNFLDITDWFIGTDMLLNKNFPIIFHSVKGNCEVIGDDRSKFNCDEQRIVLQYIYKLLNGKWNGREMGTKHIGVVTPYRKQAYMIKNMCNTNGYDEITVGTAEIFQGQERNIMIVSTVQCGGDPRFVANDLVCFELCFEANLSNTH